MNKSVLVEGKTKVIEPTDQPHIVRMIAKDFLTGGDAVKKEEIKDIGLHKTQQTANVYRMLSHNGIPTSFINIERPNTILCHRCKMLPLEFVVRRYAWGSYLKRNSHFNTSKKPHRFDHPVWEIFHKHAVVMPPHFDEPTQIEENIARDKFLKKGKWEEGVYTDPFVMIGKDWELFSAKEPIDGPCLMKTKKLLSDLEFDNAIHNIIIPSFEVIEKNWKEIETIDGPVHLVDIKFELGIKTIDDTLVLSDVVDNDSWRIWPGGKPNKQLDKQSFREGEDLVNVANKYQLVTKLTNQFQGVK